MDDYWLSRRPKYSDDEIFRIGMNYILARNLITSRLCLELATKNNHPEAQFVLNCIKQFDAVIRPDLGMDIHEINYDRGSIFGDIHDPRAAKYALWFSAWDNLRPEFIEYIKETLDDEPMMLHAYAEINQMIGNNEISLEYFSKAAAKRFAPAMHSLSKSIFWVKLTDFADCETEAAVLLRRAVNLGYDRAISDVLDICSTSHNYARSWKDKFQFTYLETCQLQAKSCLLDDPETMRKVVSVVKTYNARPDTSTYIGQEAVMIYFVYGREFDDHEKYHANLRVEFSEVIERTVPVYRQMTTKARQGGIHTMLVLKTLGVVKDIRIVIAKLVYDSRADVEWYVR